MSNKKTIIHVENGCIISIASTDNDMVFEVIDHDNEIEDRKIIFNSTDLEEGMISITWSVEDVLMEAEQINVSLTKEQALEILDSIERNHDAGIGINWDVISNAIGNYISNNRP